MNSFLYLLGTIGSAVLGAVFLVIGLDPKTDEMLPFAPLPLVVATIVQTVMFYKMWSAIQGPEARMSGGAAAGLIWVPVFNIYWIFQVLPGFATDYNRTAAARGLDIPRLPWGLFLASLLLSPIPLVGWILQAIVIVKICGAVNRLRQAQPAARTRPPKLPASQPVQPIILEDE